MRSEVRDWAHETFGEAELGDRRRVDRLINIAQRAAKTPHGRISQVFRDTKEREGAYDFVENSGVDVKELMAGVALSSARQASVHEFVFAPVDGSSLKLWDGTGRKDFGRIGTHAANATGLKVMNALLLSPDGVPIGLGAQSWWTRPLKRQKYPRMEKREISEKETQYWFDCFQQMTEARTRCASNTRLWFQLDRGADAWTILDQLGSTEDWFTIRSRCDRRLADGQSFMRKTLQKLPVSSQYQIEVPARTGHKDHSDRKSRIACISVRAKEIHLRLHDKRRKKVKLHKVNALLVRESRTTPRSEPPIQWILLTNHPIETEQQLAQVIKGYTYRWRIEDFHKAWKSGVCNVEETQLHKSASVIRWATILAAVAVQAEQLKLLSRSVPDAPATEVLSEDEIGTLRLLRRKYGPRSEVQPQLLTAALVTRWIADLGGYTGKSSGGPPGSITIQRGLHYLLIATEARTLGPPNK